MRLCEALGLPESGVLSLVGGGGKSSLLLRLTKEWSVDRRVVAVTTTHITRAQGEALGLLLLGGSPDALHAALREHSAVCAALSAEGDKLSPPPPALLRAAIGSWRRPTAPTDSPSRRPPVTSRSCCRADMLSAWPGSPPWAAPCQRCATGRRLPRHSLASPRVRR